MLQKFHWRWLTWPPVVTFGVVFIIYLIVSYLRLDPDFGWHLRSGEYFLSHGIPATDIFTYTASNFPWISHEWLSDIFLSAVYSGGGYILLSVVYSALWTLAIWIVGRKAHNLTILLAVLATVPFAGVRAITWSVLCLALLVTIIQAKNHRFRLLIPLLFLVWANIHGSFVIGFMYLMYIAITRRSWRLMALTGVGGLLTLINPYGFGIYTEVIRTVADSSLRFRITEWNMLSIPWMTIPYVLLWACGFTTTGEDRLQNNHTAHKMPSSPQIGPKPSQRSHCYALSALVNLGRKSSHSGSVAYSVRGLEKWRKYLGIDVIFFIAGVASMRTLVLFVLLSLNITDERIRAIAAMIPKDLDKPRRRFVVIIGIIIALWVLFTVVGTYRGVSIDRELNYPKNAVTYLQQHPCKGALFNHYNYGGYLIWKLPSQKVYIDGRMPSWSLNGHKYMDDYLAIEKDHDKRQKQFAIYNVHCVLERKNSDKTSIINDLIKQHWRVVATDPDSLLLIR